MADRTMTPEEEAELIAQLDDDAFALMSAYADENGKTSSDDATGGSKTPTGKSKLGTESEDKKDAPVIAGLPEGTRQILTVDKVTFFSANWQPSSANTTPESQSYALLSGRPTPSSDVTHAYIYFGGASKLRRPSYNERTGRINMYFDIAFQHQTLKQLEQARRYLWVGHFAGGHIYGDLHSAD